MWPQLSLKLKNLNLQLRKEIKNKWNNFIGHHDSALSFALTNIQYF